MGEGEKNNVLKEGPMYLYLQYFSHCCTKRGQKCFGSQFGKLNITFHTGWKLWYPWTHSLLFILWVKVTTTYSCHKSVNTVSPICVHLKGYKGSVVWTAFSSTKQNLAPLVRGPWMIDCFVGSYGGWRSFLLGNSCLLWESCSTQIFRTKLVSDTVLTLMSAYHQVAVW